MPGWLKSAYGWAIGGIDDLWNKTLGLISTLYSYVSSVIGAIDTELGSIYNGLVHLIDSVENWAQSTIAQTVSWVRTLYNNLTSYIVSLFNHAMSYINDVYKWAAGAVGAIYTYIRGVVSSITSWAIRNIYDPVARAINTLANWITTYGYVAYRLVTHPDELAKILAHYIWTQSVSLADQYAAPIASWLLRGMLRMANPVGKVIEDIIASLIE